MTSFSPQNSLEPQGFTSKPHAGSFNDAPHHTDHGYSSGYSAEGSILDIWNILNIIKKWWWLIFLFTAMIVGLTALVVFRMTPVYMASSVLEVKQQERQIFNNSDVENFTVDKEFFDTQVELLKSVSLAESVVDSLNLVADPDFSIDAMETRENKRKRVVQQFAKTLKISPVGRSRLIKISFESTNPEIASRVANTVTDTFISFNMERKYNATSYARDFIEERLKSTKIILEESERELARYATDNELITVRDEKGNTIPGYLAAAALISLDAELTSALTNRVEHEKRYKLALEKLSTTEIQNSATLTNLKTQYVELNAEYLEKIAIYKPQFPEMKKLKSRIDYLSGQIASETQLINDTMLAELKTQYDVAIETEQDLQKRVETLKVSAVDIRKKSVDYNILEREVSTNRTQYDALLQRLKEVSISDDIGSNLITLVDHAVSPTSPFKPNKLLALLLSGLLGGMLITGIVFAIEFIDDRIKSPDDIKTKLKSTIMGVIPRAKDMTKVTDLLSDPQSSIAEAYASLRTNLQFSGPNGGPKVIHMTSTRSGEGKSVSSLALALRFAGLNENVLLIDADMRLPTFTNKAGDNTGLSGLLTSTKNPLDHVHQTKFDNLSLLPSGQLVPNSSEILSTYRLTEVLDILRDQYDRIIVDSPPVMGLSDALVLGANCDASLVVVQFSSVRTPAVKATLDRLKSSGTKTLGVVLTKYKAPSKGYLNYYQYSYGENASQYGSAKPGKKSKAALAKDFIDIL